MIFPGALPSPAGSVGLRGVSNNPVPDLEGGSSDGFREAPGLEYEEESPLVAMAKIYSQVVMRQR